MRLTLEKALDISIELWQRLVETGKGFGNPLDDADWNIKQVYLTKAGYGKMLYGCPLCEYAIQQEGDELDDGGCVEYCPLAKDSGEDFACDDDPTHPYAKWRDATSVGQRARYAEEFVELLKELRTELEEPKMCCPDEAGAIDEKIRIEANGYSGFRRFDLVRVYPGAHHTSDWQIRLDLMVENGELTVAGEVYSTTKPEEVWEDVTEECKVIVQGNRLVIMYGDFYVISLGADGLANRFHYSLDAEYGIASDSNSTELGIETFHILRKVQ